jgi:hypothetical protein
MTELAARQIGDSCPDRDALLDDSCARTYPLAARIGACAGVAQPTAGCGTGGARCRRSGDQTPPTLDDFRERRDVMALVARTT